MQAVCGAAVGAQRAGVNGHSILSRASRARASAARRSARRLCNSSACSYMRAPAISDGSPTAAAVSGASCRPRVSPSGATASKRGSILSRGVGGGGSGGECMGSSAVEPAELPLETPGCGIARGGLAEGGELGGGSGGSQAGRGSGGSQSAVVSAKLGISVSRTASSVPASAAAASAAAATASIASSHTAGASARGLGGSWGTAEALAGGGGPAAGEEGEILGSSGGPA